MTASLRDYLAFAQTRAATHGARQVLCEVAVHLGVTSTDIATLGLFRDWHPADPEPGLAPPSGWERPDLLGVVREALVDRVDRRQDGVFYTPSPLADALATHTLDPLAGRTPLIVCDPAAGGGSLLLAAVRFITGHGGDPRTLRLVAVDCDELALATTEAALRLTAPGLVVDIVVGDALGAVEWPRPGPGRFDAVLANPPFLSQLARATARSRPQAAAALDRFGPSAGGYADTAGLFAMLAVDLVRPGGRIGLILPEPMLATRDSAPVRSRVGAATRLDRMWLEPASTFAAGVRVCVTVLERSGATGQSNTGAPDDAWARGEWAALAADALGVPRCDVSSSGTLGDICACVADFRDQFYGVAGITVDDATARHRARPRLVTSGLIDPLDNLWGTRPARVDKRDFDHPRADLAALPDDHPLRRWAVTRLVPKVLLATQTAVLEAIPDEDGSLLPMVPVISVIPRDPTTLWRAIAVLSAPPISAVARRRAAGAALSRDAIKLSAKQVAALPLPADENRWAEGARAAQRAAQASECGDRAAWQAALEDLGAAMCQAYRVDPGSVVPWWWARIERSISRREARAPAGRERSGS